MKNLYSLNLVSILVTAGLYLTFWFGLLAHIALGGLQVICAIVIAFNYRRLQPMTKILFLVYATLSTGLLSAFTIETSTIYILWIGSAFLALYFLYITYRIKNNYYERRNSHW